MGRVVHKVHRTFQRMSVGVCVCICDNIASCAIFEKKGTISNSKYHLHMVRPIFKDIHRFFLLSLVFIIRKHALIHCIHKTELNLYNSQWMSPLLLLLLSSSLVSLCVYDFRLAAIKYSNVFINIYKNKLCLCCCRKTNQTIPKATQPHSFGALLFSLFSLAFSLISLSIRIFVRFLRSNLLFLSLHFFSFYRSFIRSLFLSLSLCISAMDSLCAAAFAIFVCFS